jgi:hypothetical protein
MSKKEQTEAANKAMEEFLANGGVIQQGAYRQSGRVEGAPYKSPWGAKKAGRPAKTDELPEDDFGIDE